MSEPQVLAQKQTMLVQGVTGTKMGTLLVLGDRFTFMQTKYLGGATGGLLGVAIADALQKKHEEGGPMLDVPLSTVTGWHREKKLLNKKLISIDAGGQTYLFNDGWEEISAGLRTALTALGRQVTDIGPEAAQVT